MSRHIGGVLRLAADRSLRRRHNGRVLAGGSPLRVLRLTEGGARLVDTWLRGQPVEPCPEHRRLAGQLIRAGVAHPLYDGGPLGPGDVTVVVPVRDQAEMLESLLSALSGTRAADVVVVDDGSAAPLPGAAVRHPVSRGPAAARNAGWRRARTSLVAFLDADTVPGPDWLGPLLRHFDDPTVVAVAPRVRSLPGRTALARYEQARSSLDLGPAAASVRPGSRVGHVPSAALVVRSEALRGVGGFDERMRFGEDVDLVWRLAQRGGQVRYEPGSVVHHAPRARWSQWLRQRYQYGTSAAALAVRHGSAVTPVRISKWSALAWFAVFVGRPGAGLAVAGVGAGLLARRLTPMGVPAGEALRLAGLGHLGAGRVLGDAIGGAWWPPAAPILLLTRRGRRLLALLAARHLLEWSRARPRLGPGRWLAARAADDLAYGAGVWSGVISGRFRGGAARALLPELSDWPSRGVRRRSGQRKRGGEAAEGRS